MDPIMVTNPREKFMSLDAFTHFDDTPVSIKPLTEEHKRFSLNMSSFANFSTTNFEEHHDDPMQCFIDDDFEESNCNLTLNSLSLDCLLDPTLQDDTQIVKGGPSGPNAQNVTTGSVHTALVSERDNSVNSFPTTSNDRSHMKDVPVEQSEYFDQWIRASAFSLKASDDTQFIELQIPLDLLNGPGITGTTPYNPALNLFNSSAFVSWDKLHAYVSVSAPPNVSGLGILTAVPKQLYPAKLRFGDGSDFFKSQLEIDKVRAFNMPHVKVSYTESNSAVLTVPWSYHTASISTTSNMIVPQTALRLAYFNFIAPDAGVGSESEIDLTIFVRFEGLRGEGKRPLNVPMSWDPAYAYGSFQDDDRPFVQYSMKYTDLCNKEGFRVSYIYTSSGPPHSRTWSAKAVVNDGRKNASYQTKFCFSKQDAKQEAIKYIVNDFNPFMDKGEFQDLTSVLDTVSNIAGTVSDLANPAKLTSTVGSIVSGGLSKILGGITLDAPWAPPAAESRVIPLSVDNFPGGVGPRKVVVMDIDDSNHESPFEGVSYSDPDLTDAFHRPGFLFAAKIPVNTQPGVLFHIPVTIIDGCMSFDGVSDLDSGVFKPTPGGMLASAYQYMQGTKLYEFLVVKSVMQTVTLNFAFNPTFPAPDMHIALSARGETVTFQEDVAKIIEAPVISPWRYFPYNTPRMILKGETGEPMISYGYLTVSLVNKITSNALCADHINLVVSSKFSDDSKFYCPRVSNLTTAFSGPVCSNSLLTSSSLTEVEEGKMQDDDEPMPLEEDEKPLDLSVKKDDGPVLVEIKKPDFVSFDDVLEYEEMEVEYENELESEIHEESVIEYDEEQDYDECGIYEDEPMELGEDGEFQDDVNTVEENGNTAAPPVVVTDRVGRALDGFGVAPTPKDCARRFDDLFTFKGKIASDVDGTVRLFAIPITPIPTKTISPGSSSFQINSPNAFQILSLTHAYFAGSVDINVSVVGCANGTATVKFVNGLPMFAYNNTTSPILTASESLDWKVIDIVSPTSVPALVDQVIRDYTGMRAKEKRSLEMNNQLTLGLPTHTEFSAVNCVPNEITTSFSADSQNNMFWQTNVRPTVMGTLIIAVEIPSEQTGLGSIVVDMRAADSAHWSWPTGTPLCGTSVGKSQNVIYSMNILETPYYVKDGTKGIFADMNTSLQYFSRPVGGSVGVKMYPLRVSHAASLAKKRLLESGDVETNPGPVMSTLNDGSFSGSSASTASVKQWLHSMSNRMARTVNSVGKIPSVIDQVHETVPAVRNAADNLNESSLRVGAAADTFNESSAKVGAAADTLNGILGYVKEKLARVFDLPIQSFASIVHYIQIMLDAKKKSVTISCFAGILFHLGLISFDAIALLASKVTSLFSGKFQAGESKTLPSVGLRYFNIVFSFILAGIGLVFTPLKKIPGELLNKTTAIFRNINSVDVFMKNNFDLISEGTVWYASKKQQCELMLMNLGTIKPEVEEWLTTANVVCSPEFSSKIGTDTKKQQKLIDCAKKGTVLYDKLVKMRTESEERSVTTVFNIVDKMLARVRDVYLEHAKSFLLKDKYSVPFCVWIYGKPGIGKSFIVPKLAAAFMKEMHIPCDSDPLYRRTAGAKFWDGLEDQLLLWMSDPEQDNSDEGITQFIRDWYEIHSPIPFNPNMANVNDKGKSHKFLGTFVDSNSFYAEKRKLVLSDDAFKSRRDIVAEVIISREFTAHIHKLGFEGRAKIEEFSKHVKEHPEDAFPGFEDLAHLCVRYSFDGTKRPSVVTEVSFPEFTKIMVKKLVELVKIRRIFSKEKKDLFEELTADNTAKRLAELSVAEVSDIISTIGAISGMETAKDLNEKVEKAREEDDDDDDSDSDEEDDDVGELQDDTSIIDDNVDLKDEFFDCKAILDTNAVSCVHSFFIKHGHEDYNVCILNGKLTTFTPGEVMKVFCEGDELDIFELHETFCHFKQNQCNCSDYMKRVSFDFVKDHIDEDDLVKVRRIMGVKAIKLVDFEPPTTTYKLFKFFSAVVVAGALIYLIVYLCKRIFGKGKAQDYERQMKTPKTKTPGSKILQLNNPKFQDLEDVIMKGCGRFKCTYLVKEVLHETSTNMYCLGGTAWFLPGHTVKKLQEANPQTCTFMYKTHAGTPIVMTVPWKECTSKYLFCEEHDVGVITHPRLQPVRDKINLFASPLELSNISSELCVYDWNGGLYKKTIVTNAKVQIAAPEGKQQQLLTYKGFQGNGLCASPVVDQVSGKIVAFHNSGWPSGMGGATICGKALLLKLRESCGALFTDVHDIETVQVENEMQNDFCVVEKITDPTFIGRISTKSSLQKSSLYGVLGEPEKVIPQGKMQDAFECMKPYSKEPKYLVLPERIVDAAAKEYEDVIMKEAPPVSAYKPRPLPLKTALEGIPNLPFHLPPMRDTSSGLPLLNLGLPKKGQCFTETIDQNGRNITGIHPKFAAQYNEFVTELLAGKKPRSNAMLFLKDERKKPAKAIRGINGSDFVTHVLFLQYFLPFFAAFRKAKFRVGSAIGCNIDAEAFDMFKYMGEVEEEVAFTDARYITADYKNFGPTIIHHVAGKMIDIIVNWYLKYGDVTPQDVLMMRRLFALLINSDHIVLQYWFRPQQGIFSGNPFTAEFNTFVNNLYIRCAWVYTVETNDKLYEMCKENLFYYFRKAVRIVTYGDDLVARTHSAFYPIFNNVTIKKFMDLIGLEFTDALKRPTMVETDAFENVSFLKRTFHLHPNRYDTLLAALDLGTIRDMICYVRGKGENEQKSVVIAKDAVRFLHGHGQTTFDEMRSKIVSACADSDSDVLRSAEFMTWPQVDAQIFDVQDEFVRSILDL